MARAFNRMLARLGAPSTQREFIRDITHELRTPIAVSRGHIELLAKGRFSEEGLGARRWRSSRASSIG